MNQVTLHRWLAWSPRRALLVALALWGLTVWVDVVTGAELTMAPFYVLPIVLVAWTNRTTYVAAFAFASAALTCALDRIQGFPYTHPAYLYWAGFAHLVFYALIAWLTTALRRAYVRVEELAQFDPLTQLYNRRAFQHLAHRELARASRGRQPVSLLFIDLDDFKQVNDTHGHAEGDEVLRCVGQWLAYYRATDIPVRYGGDEFVLFLADTGEKAARAVAERLRGDLLASMAAHGWGVTVSMGLVTYDTAPMSVDVMLGRADGLAYRVKHGGKDGIEHEIVREPEREMSGVRPSLSLSSESFSARG